MSLSQVQVFSTALLTLKGLQASFLALMPLRARASAPQVWGEAMLLPFISCVPLRVNLGTGVMAPPGALTVTPTSPSMVGPRELQVYGVLGIFCLLEYIAVIIEGKTYAPGPHAYHSVALYVGRRTNSAEGGAVIT